MTRAEKEYPHAANVGAKIRVAEAGTENHSLTTRREAALRMPPLPSGYRDPFEDRPAFSEDSTRALCRELWAQGFDIEYLERRYGVTRRTAVNA